MPFAQIGDISIHYHETGHGLPLLFISGAGCDRTYWQPLVEQLRHSYRCISFDNRGVGQTDKPLPPYSIAQMAKDALGLMDHLQAARFHVVGHSMGGYIAQEIALVAPQRCLSLTLIGTGPRPEPYTVFLMGLRKALVRRLERQRFLEASAASMFSPVSFRHKRELIDSFIQAGAQPSNPQPDYAYDAHFDACIAYDSSDHFTGIRMPTLVMVGDDDILTPPHLSRQLAAGIPGARLAIIPEAGHMVLLEHPDRLVKELQAFLASVPQRV